MIPNTTPLAQTNFLENGNYLHSFSDEFWLDCRLHSSPPNPTGKFSALRHFATVSENVVTAVYSFYNCLLHVQQKDTNSSNKSAPVQIATSAMSTNRHRDAVKFRLTVSNRVTFALTDQQSLIVPDVSICFWRRPEIEDKGNWILLTIRALFAIIRQTLRWRCGIGIC